MAQDFEVLQLAIAQQCTDIAQLHTEMAQLKQEVQEIKANKKPSSVNQLIAIS